MSLVRASALAGGLCLLSAAVVHADGERRCVLSPAGRGCAWISQEAPRFSEPRVRVFDPAGKLRLALTLGEVFRPHELAGFARRGSALDWLRDAWWDDASRELVLVSRPLRAAIDPIGVERVISPQLPVELDEDEVWETRSRVRVLSLADGRVRPGDRRDLLRALLHPDARVRWRAWSLAAELDQDLAGELGLSPPALRAWVRAAGPQPAPRTQGELLLRVTQLLILAQSPASVVRLTALDALGELGPAAAERAVPALRGLLERLPRTERQRAVAALARYGPAARPAVSRLCELSRGRGRDRLRLRINAFRALRSIGCAGPSVLAALLRGLEDPDHEAREAALWALAALDPQPGRAAHELARRLRHPSRSTRLAATRALAGLGAHAAPAAPRLRTFLAGRDPRLAEAARATLAQLPFPQAAQRNGKGGEQSPK